MDPKFKQIIEQATKLAERAIPAFEAEDRLAIIEPQFKEAQAKLSKIAQSEGALRIKADRLANNLVTRGVLDAEQKVAFVDSIVENPMELVDVADRLSSQLKVDSFGKVAEQQDFGGDKLDPFERLATE